MVAVNLNRLILVAVVCLSLLVFARAQFPRACINADSFGRKECCPVPAGFSVPCGGAGRGLCDNFTDPTPTNQTGWRAAYNQDDRRRWPSVFFTTFCRCEGNFAGPDCSKCKWGFYGADCTETKTLTRKNVLKLSADEEATFVAYVNKTKYTQSDYVVASGFYVDANTVPQFRNVSVYDYFVYLQYYADVPSAPSGLDFGHGSSGFLTSNRLMLLAFERAVQEVNNDTDFTIPFYHWTDTPSCNSSNVCKNDLVGANDASGALQDTVFSNWETVCVQSDESAATPCDVSTTTGKIVRKASGNLPTQDEVDFALRFGAFDKAGYNTMSDCSFRNLLEGFVNTTSGVYDSTRTYLSEQVHTTLGGEGGTMSQHWHAANDPIFYLHRSFVDRIFERWLRRHNVAVEDALPESGAAPGHNRNESIVPFFPPVPHANMYKMSTDLGYDYQDIGAEASVGTPVGPADCPVPPTTPMSPMAPTTRASGGAGFDGGLIAGLVVAGLLGLGAIGLIAYCATTATRAAKPGP